MHAVKLEFRALLAKDATILGGPSSVLQAPHQQSGTYITQYMRKALLPLHPTAKQVWTSAPRWHSKWSPSTASRTTVDTPHQHFVAFV